MYSNEKPNKRSPAPLVSAQLGVWHVLMEGSAFDPRQSWNAMTSIFPLIRRFWAEVYHLGPGLIAFFILSKVWTGIESALLLYLSSRLLLVIETGMTEGRPDVSAIAQAVGARLICVALVAIIEWWSAKLLPVLRTRIICHFQIHLMRAKLRVDLPTSQEHSSKARVTAREAWDAFEEIMRVVTEFLMTASQLALIVQSSRSNGGPLFAALCVAKPIFCALTSRSIWHKVHIVHSNNTAYLRMKALEKLSGDGYRQDVISGNFSNYILEEYDKARKSLGDVSDEYHSIQYMQRDTPNWEVASSFLGDLPMVYCAANAILNPSRFSVTSIAILQQSSSTLRWTLESILNNGGSFRRNMNQVRKLYNVSDVNNCLSDGDVPYPSSNNAEGMSFELRGVSFAYPGSKSTTNALNKVSISIKAGQLVVIVGANGSGKSTIIKLLSRLYDPTTGDILVDGKPIQSYRISDLRQATATLTQDIQLYPLSLSENIGLGNSDSVSDIDMVARSAEQGGAYDCISKLVDGFSTTLDPVSTAYGINIEPDSSGPLQQELEKLEKTVNISGGERQRVVASRTFMRFTSGKVRFVAVDEPSSALDPEGEFQLFERLRDSRTGKTMVFVTHRFGHLTKYADLILCMKEGSVAEAGTHEELLALDGEYSKLYNIQARAFAGIPEESSG